AELGVPTALTHRWPSLTGLEGAPAYNVGRAYAAFAADIENGTHAVPDFADAVRRHHVIAAIERSSASGERVTISPAVWRGWFPSGATAHGSSGRPLRPADRLTQRRASVLKAGDTAGM